MTSRVDLHLHTVASDGRLTPAEIVSKAAYLGVQVIAISDHDTVDGVAPALVAAHMYPSLRVIPAVELSTDVPKGEVHMLGYFVDHTDAAFNTRLAHMRDSREDRARRMVERLNRLGLRISFERVKEIAGSGAMGRPHVAQALLEKGYVTSFQDAFRRYIGAGGKAYVGREKLTPAEAVELVLKAGGLPVLAHPLTSGAVEETIVELKAVGLVGMEVYYAGYSDEEITPLAGLANKHGLIATGGTDYHGISENNETMIGGIDVPMEAASQLLDLARERGLKSAAGFGT